MVCQAKESSRFYRSDVIILPGRDPLCRTIKQDLKAIHSPFSCSRPEPPCPPVEGLRLRRGFLVFQAADMEPAAADHSNRFFNGTGSPPDTTIRPHFQYRGHGLVHREKGQGVMTKPCRSAIHTGKSDLSTSSTLVRDGVLSRNRSCIRNHEQSASKSIATDRHHPSEKKGQSNYHDTQRPVPTEVMYRIGIQTQSYFPRAFTKELADPDPIHVRRSENKIVPLSLCTRLSDRLGQRGVTAGRDRLFQSSPLSKTPEKLYSTLD